MTYGIPLMETEINNLNDLASQLKVSELDINRIKANSMNEYNFVLGLSTDKPCPFLTKEKLCSIHLNWGKKLKPKICQLFPFSFTYTPNGYYLYPSFASTAVIFNMGQALTQQDFTDKLNLFLEIYPNLNLDWNNIYLLDGEKIDFKKYLKHEEHILNVLDSNNFSFKDKLFGCLDYFCSLNVNQLKIKDLDNIDPKQIDGHIVSSFYNFIFKQTTDIDLNSTSFMMELLNVSKSDNLNISLDNNLYTKFRQLSKDDREVLENILSRFFYARIFAKLYFGPGFNNLSLIAGFNHLILIVLLTAIESTLFLHNNPEIALHYDTMAKVIRHVERRFTLLKYSPKTLTILEVLLTCQDRMTRLVDTIL